jgi:hypothetical protein
MAGLAVIVIRPVIFSALVAFAGPAAATSPAPGGKQCTVAIDAVQARLDSTKPTSSPDQWSRRRAGVGSSVGSSVGHDHGGESWMGGSAGRARAEELLFNAGRLHQAGKEENCLVLVREARRAVGME